MRLLEISHLTDPMLRQEIIRRLDTADREMLDRIYQALETSGMDERMAAALVRDPEALRIRDHLADIIMLTRAGYQEKMDFLDRFNQGMIDIDRLLSAQSSVNQWFVGGAFGMRVFLRAMRLIIPRVGMAELALAAFSPDIRKSAPGDLLINTSQGAVSAEVKTRKESWGRFHNPDRMQYNMAAIERAFKKVGLGKPEDSKSYTLKNWLTDRQRLDSPVRVQLAGVIVDSLFRHAKDDQLKYQLMRLLATGGDQEIRAAWAALSFDNYKSVEGFTGILMIDANSGETRWITNAAQVANMAVDSLQIIGAASSAMPKIGWK